MGAAAAAAANVAAAGFDATQKRSTIFDLCPSFVSRVLAAE